MFKQKSEDFGKWKFLAGTLAVIIFVFILFDFFNWPTKLGISAEIIQAKNLFYFGVAAFLSLMIYYSQNSNSDSHSIQLQNKINQIFPLTKNDEINDKVRVWMTRDKSNTQGIIFYFPFSLIPGFWVEPRLFEKFIENFDTLNVNNHIKLLFIGPKETDYNFKTILESITLDDKTTQLPGSKTNALNSNFNKSKLGDYINITDINKRTFKDDNEKLTYIKSVFSDKYAHLIGILRKEQISRTENIYLHEIETINCDYWKTKPPFSIIIRCRKKDKSFDAIITDTFNIVKDFNAGVLYNGSNSHAIFKPVFSKVREDPNNYEFQNQDITNLFVNNLLLTLESEVIDKIKIVTK